LRFPLVLPHCSYSSHVRFMFVFPSRADARIRAIAVVRHVWYSQHSRAARFGER
jgi:hypothetical protein